MAFKEKKEWLRCSCGAKSKQAKTKEIAFKDAQKLGWTQIISPTKQITYKCSKCTCKIQKLLQTQEQTN